VLAGRENELNSIKASLFFGSILRFKILEGILQGWKRGDGPRKSRDVKLVNPSENREERRRENMRRESNVGVDALGSSGGKATKGSTVKRRREGQNAVHRSS
jgi:hypothetical protein